MPRVQGAYELGKALLEQLKKATKQIDLWDSEGRRLVVSREQGVQLLVQATIKALSDAGFAYNALVWRMATREAEGRVA